MEIKQVRVTGGILCDDVLWTNEEDAGFFKVEEQEETED